MMNSILYTSDGHRTKRFVCVYVALCQLLLVASGQVSHCDWKFNYSSLDDIAIVVSTGLKRIAIIAFSVEIQITKNLQKLD